MFNICCDKEAQIRRDKLSNESAIDGAIICHLGQRCY